MPDDIRAFVAQAQGNPWEAAEMLAGLLSINKGKTFRGSMVYDQNWVRSTFLAGHPDVAALAATAVWSATPAELGRAYGLLLDRAGAAGCWAALLAAADGRGHRRATERAVEMLVTGEKWGARRAVRPGHVVVPGRWQADAATVAAIERVLGVPVPGDLTSTGGCGWKVRHLVACLRPLSAAEKTWWLESGYTLTIDGVPVFDPADDPDVEIGTLPILWAAVAGKVPCGPDVVARRVTPATAGAVEPSRMVAVLRQLYRRAPQVAETVVAACAAGWEFAASPLDTMYWERRRDGVGVWDAPLEVARTDVDAAAELWNETCTAPTAPALLAAAADGLDPQAAGLAAVLSAGLNPDRVDPALMGLIEAARDELPTCLLAGALPPVYRYDDSGVAAVAMLAEREVSADAWLLGRDCGVAGPQPGTAAGILETAGRTVDALTAVAAHLDGLLTVDEIVAVSRGYDLERFINLYGDRPALCPPELRALVAAR